jgi:hypothetical protein
LNDLRLSKFWNREVEFGLPDCRLRHGERQPVLLHGTRLAVDAVFCANCGTLEGYATVETPHIFFICDTCVGCSGKPSGLTEVTKKQMAERGLRVVPV